MIGSWSAVVSMERVPLRDVLPHDYLAVEDELRRLATQLDSHSSAVDRVARHWYPEHNSPPPASDELRIYLLLVDTAISLYDADSDWLELTLDIAWQQPSKLTVNAAVEVACWCMPDHNMHQVRTVSRQIANSHELVEAFAAGASAASRALVLIYQGTRPCRSWKVPVGPPGGRVARWTITSVPSVTVCVPRWLLKSVPVKPGSAAFTRMPCSARAYCIVSMVSAALVAG
jgi:hypothetical protein